MRRKSQFVGIVILLLTVVWFSISEGQSTFDTEVKTQSYNAEPTRQPHLKYQVSTKPLAESRIPTVAESDISPSIDVVFAIDNTGSMSGTINTVKNDVPVIANNIMTEFPDTWFGSIKFRDYGDIFITEIVTQPGNDIAQFQTGINTMFAGGGWDWPEAYVETVIQGVNEIVWRPGALRLLVVIGDAPPHDPIYGTGVSGSGASWSDAANMAVNKGVIVSMVAVGGGIGPTEVYDSYNYMADATGGCYVESSNPTEVSNALIDLVNQLAGDKPVVLSTTPAAGETDVPVDTLITATFNMDMDGTTLNPATIYIDAGHVCLLMDATYDASTKTLSIIPFGPLSEEAMYTVVLTDSIKSSDGVNLARYSWSFSTPDLTPHDAVKQKLESLRRTAKNTMQVHSNLVADYVYRGSAAMSDDQRLMFGKLVADSVFGLAAGDVKLYGPGTKGITSGLRTAIEVSRTLSELSTIRKELQILIDNKHMGQLEGIYPESVIDFPPTFTECRKLFDTEYAFYEYVGINPAPSFYGVNGAIEEIDMIINAAIASISLDISKEEADLVNDYLDSQIAKLIEARTQETMTIKVEEDYCRLVPIGSITTWGDMLDWGIEYLGVEEGAMLTGSIVKAAGALIKIGGVGTSWTGFGLGLVAWGDIIFWGSEIGEISWEILAGVELSPIDTIEHVVIQSTLAFNDEILTQLDFLKGTTIYVETLTSTITVAGGCMALVSGGVAIPAGDDLTVVDMDFPPLNVFESSQETGHVTVLNSSANAYRIALMGAILGPCIDEVGRPIIGFLMQHEVTEILPGETATLNVSYGIPNTFMYGLEPFLVKVEIFAIPDFGVPVTFGPYVADMWAGGAAEISASASVNTENIFEGVVSPGDRQELQIVIPSGLERVVLTLCVKDGTEADLHLFDPDGNHVGFNYSNITTENEIPNATYSGADAKVECIKVNQPIGGIYVVRVIGRMGPARFIVHKADFELLPALFTTEPRILGSGYRGEDVQIQLPMREVVGVEGVTGITISPSDLVHVAELDKIIPLDHIAVGDYSDSLLPGEQVIVPLTISIPSDATLGKYDGNITLTHSVGSHEVDVVLEVLEEIKQFSLTCSVIGGHGSISPDSGAYEEGTIVTLNASPNPGYKVKAWSGTNNDASKSTSNTVTMDSDKTVTVEFEVIPVIQQYQLNASVVGGNGTISPTSGTYEKETKVTLTATPDIGYRVKAWTGTNDNTSTENTNFVTINSDKTVTVEFEKDIYNLTASVIGGNGTVDPNSGTYDAGTVIELTAIPNQYYRVKGWHGTDNDSSKAATNTVLMDSAKTVTVEFEIIPVTLSASVGGGNGQISPDSGVYDAGTVIDLTATPDQYYRVKAWHGTDNDSSKTATNTVLMDSAKTVTVEFEIIPVTLSASVGGGNGQISPASGIHDAGTVIDLTAMPDQYYRVKAWHGTDNDSSTDATNTVFMSSDKTVSVEFEQIPVTLTVNMVGGKNPPAASVKQSLMGNVEQVTAEPIAPGYRVRAWHGTDNDSSRESTNAVLMDSDKAVTVELASVIVSNKFTVKAGIERGLDSVDISGSFNATMEEISNAGAIYIKIWTDAGFAYEPAEPIPFDPNAVKKGNYSYRQRIGKGEPGGISSFRFNLNKHTFSLAAKNLDLKGLMGPILVDISFGDYVGLAEAGEDTINGKKYIPMSFMRSHTNSLRVDQVSVREGKNDDSDYLMVQGALAVEFISVKLNNQDVTVTWGNHTFVIPEDSFKEPKKGEMYTCRNIPDQNGNGIISATIDLAKCTFKIIIKNADISHQGNPIDFSMQFADFSKTVTLQLTEKKSNSWSFP